jgi:hypothetical protein
MTMNRIHVFINSQVLLILCCLFAMIICTDHLANPHTSYAGEIYRWVDENGEVHYSDTDPGDSLSKGNKTKSIYIDESPAVEKESKASPQKQKKSDTLRAASSKDVTIYTLDT